MDKLKLIRIGYFIISIFLILILFKNYKNTKYENQRLRNNQTALITVGEKYRTENGEMATRIIQLEITKGEYEKLFPELREEIKNLKIKNKYLTELSKTATSTRIDTSTILRDTIYVTQRDTLYARKFNYDDGWNKIKGVVYRDSIDIAYDGRDTLIMAAHRVPKRFLFFKYGTKYIEVDAVNKNPKVRIDFNQKIKIK